MGASVSDGHALAFIKFAFFRANEVHVYFNGLADELLAQKLEQVKLVSLTFRTEIENAHLSSFCSVVRLFWIRGSVNEFNQHSESESPSHL